MDRPAPKMEARERPYNVKDGGSKTGQVFIILDSNELKNLRGTIEGRNKKRVDAITSLSQNNLDFVSKYSSYFSIDSPELCRELIDSSSTNYVFSIGKLIGQGKVGKVYLLRGQDTYLILKSISNSPPTPYLSLRVYDYEPAMEYINPSIGFWKTFDSKNERKVLSIQGTNFSNQTCLHVLLNQIMGEQPNYLYQYDAFYCGTNGYNVTEWATAGDLEKYLLGQTITEELLRDVVTQVFTPLATLKLPQYSFVHADLKARNVFVTIEDGKPVFKIADFDKSSITWHGFRFYNATGDYRARNVPFYKDYRNRYSFAGAILPVQVYTMHNPFGFYLSYDFYTFLLSLWAIDNVYEYFMANPNSSIRKLFDSLWLDDERAVIYQQFANPATRRELTSMSSIGNMLVKTKVSLSLNFDYILGAVGIHIPVSKDEAQTMRFHFSKDGHVCLSTCATHNNSWKNWCETNPYSKQGIVKTIYEWDNC
jgi:serine/threonine protein kinase